jgi:hypothetical protein
MSKSEAVRKSYKAAAADVDAEVDGLTKKMSAVVNSIVESDSEHEEKEQVVKKRHFKKTSAPAAAGAGKSSDAVLLPASELRKKQAEKSGSEVRTGSDDDFVDRFKLACNKYSQIILDTAKEAIHASEDTDHTYAILNYEPLMEKVDGFAHTTLMYGFWDKEKQKFSQSVFLVNSIPMPFEKAQIDLKKLGYKLTNTSDIKKSKKLFLKVAW